MQTSFWSASESPSRLSPAGDASESSLGNRSYPRPLTLLKAGNHGSPLFLAHGIGGSLMQFFELLKHLDLPYPVYGMTASGMDGVEKPHDSIEEMADAFLQAIKQVQAEGPYHLIGYSLGGLVALEAAQRLRSRGEQAGFLAMIDSYPHPSYLSSRERTRLLSRLLKRRAHAAFRLRGANRLEHAARRDADSPAAQRVREAAFSAWKKYRPQFYAGSVKFVRAEVTSNFPDNARAVWASLTSDLEVETVPGDHLEMLMTHFDSLGSVLTRHLKAASCRK